MKGIEKVAMVVGTVSAIAVLIVMVGMDYNKAILNIAWLLIGLKLVDVAVVLISQQTWDKDSEER